MLDNQRVHAEITALKRSYKEEPYPALEKRKRWLRSIEKILLDSEHKFIEAIGKDFGHRSEFETLSCELFPIYSALKHTHRNLSNWMKEKKRKTSPIFWFGSSSVLFQPIGVVAIISPWNYPLQLTLIPLINAIAAGNRVLLKPSEKTYHFSLLLKEIFDERFDKSVARVICGDHTTAKHIAENEVVDHLFFTGSTEIGKEIARSAAENLTPTTLELGGKSPAYITQSANLTSAIRRVILGKIINAGQTCIAPDYLMVDKKHQENFVEIFFNILEELYPKILENSDYSAIINEKRLTHLIKLLEDARIKGGVIYIMSDGAITKLDGQKSIKEIATNLYKSERKIAPSLVLQPNFQMGVLKEEIFGPILPVFFVGSDAEALSLVEANERPLASYWFGYEKTALKKWLRNLVVGGVTVNDCLLHCIQNDLPFGGISKSGRGAYHGFWGFENFSHRKAIFSQSRLSSMNLVSPPYTKLKYTLIRLLRFFS